MRGLRHGYGVRTSAAYGVATHFRGQHGNMRGSESSLNQTAGNPVGSKAIGGAGAAGGVSGGGGGGSAAGGDETRGGFVLRTRSDPIPHRRRSLVERSGMKSFVQVCPSLCCTGSGGNTVSRFRESRTLALHFFFFCTSSWDRICAGGATLSRDVSRSCSSSDTIWVQFSHCLLTGFLCLPFCVRT